MRRLLSILLLAVIGLPFVAPAVSGEAVQELRLPACCRRAGAHHCAMEMGSTTARETHATGAHWRALSARCPYTPGAAISAPATALGASYEVHSLFTPASHPRGIPQTLCRRRIAQDRAQGKRGPPMSLLA